MGFEGANVLFDTWIHPLMMGLEEHLIMMFREDFEFDASAAGSHLGHRAVNHGASLAPISTTELLEEKHEVAAPVLVAGSAEAIWAAEAMKELGKIPFFVRGKARRNTERFAVEQGIDMITIETLYDAKAHYGR
jgi:light-independent protochlorophyllide reductase subunit B